VLKSAVNVETF